MRTLTDGFLIVQDHRLQCRQCELEGTLFVNSPLRGTDLTNARLLGGARSESMSAPCALWRAKSRSNRLPEACIQRVRSVRGYETDTSQDNGRPHLRPASARGVALGTHPGDSRTLGWPSGQISPTIHRVAMGWPGLSLPGEEGLLLRLGHLFQHGMLGHCRS
jgi:hypothetical protein